MVTDENESTSESSGEPSRTSPSGAPSAGAVVRDRFSSDEIFQRIIAAADEEVTSSKSELFFSGVAAGLAITITFLAYVSLSAATGKDPILSVLLYPIGFIFIILGGYQLYTENTLPPVALTLERFNSLPALLRHWLIVLTGNFTGGGLGGLLLAYTDVLPAKSVEVALDISSKGLTHDFGTLFVKGALAGLIVAGLVWVEYASRDTISRLAIIYLSFLLIPLCNLFHVVVSFTEYIYLFAHGGVGLFHGFGAFVLPVLLGNTVGGVILVTVVNYYQTSEKRLGSVADDATVRRLSPQEWFLGGLVGRSRVPVIEHHGLSGNGDRDYRITVALTDLERDRTLVELACLLADQHENASVHLLHIAHARSRKKLNSRARQRQRIVEQSERKLEEITQSLEGYSVHIHTSTVVTHDPFEEVISQVHQDGSDTLLMGWDDGASWRYLQSGRPIDNLTRTLPCDVLVLKGSDLDTSKILLPTSGGPSSELSGEVAAALQSAVDSSVTLLRVVDSPDKQEDGESFLEEWAEEQGLDDARLVVDDSGRVGQAIQEEAQDQTLVILGASERGLLYRMAQGSLHGNLLNQLNTSVLLTERPTSRSLFQALFGSS